MVLFRKTLFGLSVLLMTLSSVVICPPFATATRLSGAETFAKLVPSDESSFAQNQILFYDPSECATSKAGKQCSDVSVYSTLNEDDLSPTGEVDGSKITFLADSLIGIPGETMFNEYFEGADYGPSYNHCHLGDMSSYICSGKRVDDHDPRTGPGGYSILQKIVDEGKLRPILVFHLGGNGGWDTQEEYLEKIIELAGENTQIVFFTNNFLDINMDKSNAILLKAAEEHSNVIVGDWASVAKDEFYIRDGTHDGNIHHNQHGSEVYFKFIYDTIANIDSQNCSSVGLLPGNSLPEQTWNYFVQANIPGLSDNAAAISGIMGNLKQESGLNAFAGGLYGDLSGTVQRKLIDAGLGQYWGATIVPEDILSKALKVGLDQLSKENERFLGTGWASEWGFLKMVDKIKNKTPEAYSDLFEVTVEGAVTGDVISPYTHTSNYIEDDVSREIGNRVFGGNPGGGSYYQEAGTRRQYAREFFDEFGKNSITSSNATSSDYKNTEINPPSLIVWDKEGWITKGMDGYIKDPGPNLGTRYNSGKPNKILLHYTQGGSGGGMGIYANPGYAPHFTIDMPKRQVWQHHPLSEPSGAVIDSDDVRDIVQIEIAGFGFLDDNPDNPDGNSRCLINGVDYTDREYCFAKFTDEDWDYLAKLLIGISNWGKDNEADIPLTTEATWTGRVADLRMSATDFDAIKGIVAHMHAPDYGNHADTGNIWPLVKAAIERSGCSKTNDENSISGAKNADKNAEDVGIFWFADDDPESMKTDLENYGDLAYRTGQAYDIPWQAIMVHARYEDSGKNGFGSMCGKNNFWGIGCPKRPVSYENLGEAFEGYAKTVHNGKHDQALGETDPKEFMNKIAHSWVWGPGDPDWSKGYANMDGLRRSVDALMAYIDSPEGQAVVAQFGAANCGPSVDADECGRVQESDTAKGDVASLHKLLLKLAWDSSGPGSGSARPEYLDFMAKAPYKGGCGGQDCGAFVSTLVVESGWDPDYSRCYTACQVDYLEKSDKWKDVTTQIKSNADAEPGDVIICHDGIFSHHCPGRQHVLIYVGEVSGFGGEMASASLCGRWPEAEGGDISGYVSSGFHVYRKVK